MVHWPLQITTISKVATFQIITNRITTTSNHHNGSNMYDSKVTTFRSNNYHQNSLLKFLRLNPKLIYLTFWKYSNKTFYLLLIFQFILLLLLSWPFLYLHRCLVLIHHPLANFFFFFFFLSLTCINNLVLNSQLMVFVINCYKLWRQIFSDLC